MTDQQSPITPPPEIVKQWAKDVLSESGEDYSADIDLFAAKAAQWGADQELEACVNWVSEYCPYFGDYPLPEDKLRVARRPKPRSLKEQALEALDSASYQPGSDFKQIDPARSAAIRRALEQLPDTH